MSVSETPRKAGPYACNGSAREFPFEFKVFSSSEITVLTAGSDGADVVVPDGYSVYLNPDQDMSPGGTVTFTTAPAAGTALAILSNVAYIQPMVLTNQGGFYPETLNDSADRLTILIQQLLERLNRVIYVPATSSQTPEQLLTSIIDIAAHAQEYADLAAKTLEQTQALASRVDTMVVETGDAVKAEVIAVGDGQKSIILAEGDTQVQRVLDASDEALWQEGLGCQEKTWTLAEAVTAGTAITIPDSMQYIVGRHHLRLSWNGLHLFPEENFNEIGDQDHKSQQFSLAFDAEAGDLLNAWTPALGSGIAAEAIIEAQNATDAVAELSRKVVYKDEESAS